MTKTPGTMGVQGHFAFLVEVVDVWVNEWI